MKQRNANHKRSLYLCVCFTTLFTFFMHPVGELHAQNKPNLSIQITEEQKELKKLEAEIEKNRKKNLAAKKQERSILSNLEVIDRRFRLYRKEVVLLESKIKEKEQEALSLSTQIRAMGKEIENSREEISKRLRTIYKEKQSGGLKIIFAAQDYPDLLRRLYYLKTIARREEQVLSTFKTRHRDLEEKREKLVLVKKALIADRSSLTQKLTESRTEKRQKDRLLSRVRKERDLYTKTISEMTDSSEQIQALIRQLEKEKKRLKSNRSGQFSKKKGKLQWPNDGRLVGRYGRQKHPKFDTMIYRKGIEIAPGVGGEVRNVFDGTVVYADWFKGYGMVIIVDHGENYYSLYAHLEKLLVDVGDQVKMDRVIGEIGGTGLAHNAKLYFEIRHQGKPINPMAWLQKR